MSTINRKLAVKRPMVRVEEPRVEEFKCALEPPHLDKTDPEMVGSAGPDIPTSPEQALQPDEEKSRVEKVFELQKSEDLADYDMRKEYHGPTFPLSSASLENIFNQIMSFSTNIAKKLRRMPRPSSVAKNGLSVELIRQAGHRISVQHYRAYYSDDVDHIIYLPLHTKYSGDTHVHLQAKGGYTRIGITPRIDPNSMRPFHHWELAPEVSIHGVYEYWGAEEVYTSRCAEDHWWVNDRGNDVFTKGDVYCYKLGVTKALDLIEPNYARELLAGPLR